MQKECKRQILIPFQLQSMSTWNIMILHKLLPYIFFLLKFMRFPIPNRNTNVAHLINFAGDAKEDEFMIFIVFDKVHLRLPETMLNNLEIEIRFVGMCQKLVAAVFHHSVTCISIMCSHICIGESTCIFSRKVLILYVLIIRHTAYVG